MRGQDDLMHTGRLVPIYPLVDGLYQRTLRGIVKRALDSTLSQIEDHLPEDILHRTGMLGLQSAVSQMHYPESGESKEAARSRLAFDEMFMLQMAVLRRKLLWQEEESGVALNTDLAELSAFVETLPFSLTEAQTRGHGRDTGGPPARDPYEQTARRRRGKRQDRCLGNRHARGGAQRVPGRPPRADGDPSPSSIS